MMETIDSLKSKCMQKKLETNDPKFDLIENILNQDNCFFAIEMDIAIDILTSLGVEDPYLVYKNLISYEEMEKGKIKIVD